MKKQLLCILGRTGSGKDFISRQISEITNIPMVISHTTRPKRDNEVNGREHWFITNEKADEMLKSDDILAYTEIGDIRYFATLDSIKDSAIYIIDPNGLRYLKDNFGDTIDITTIYISCPYEIRKQRASNRSDFNEAFEKRCMAEDKQFRDFESKKDYDLFIDNSGKIDIDKFIKDNCIDRIFLDIDGVLLHSSQAIIDMYNDDNWTDFKGSDVLSWDFKDIDPTLTSKEITALFNDELFFEYVEFVDGAKEFLDKYRDKIIMVSKGTVDNYYNKRVFFDKAGFSDIPIIELPFELSKGLINMGGESLFIDDSCKNLIESNAKYRLQFIEYDDGRDREWCVGWWGNKIKGF